MEIKKEEINSKLKELQEIPSKEKYLQWEKIYKSTEEEQKKLEKIKQKN